MSDLHHFQHMLPSSKFEWVSDTFSVAAITSPWWLPWLRSFSELAALLLPICGVAWLLTQIGFKWYGHFKGKA